MKDVFHGHLLWCHLSSFISFYTWVFRACFLHGYVFSHRRVKVYTTTFLKNSLCLYDYVCIFMVGYSMDIDLDVIWPLLFPFLNVETLEDVCLASMISKAAQPPFQPYLSWHSSVLHPLIPSISGSAAFLTIPLLLPHLLLASNMVPITSSFRSVSLLVLFLCLQVYTPYRMSEAPQAPLSFTSYTTLRGLYKILILQGTLL